jgi:hypothetical protein
MQEGIIKWKVLWVKVQAAVIILDFDIIESRTEVLSSEPLFMIWVANYLSG